MRLRKNAPYIFLHVIFYIFASAPPPLKYNQDRSCGRWRVNLASLTYIFLNSV